MLKFYYFVYTTSGQKFKLKMSDEVNNAAKSNKKGKDCQPINPESNIPNHEKSLSSENLAYIEQNS